MAYAIRIMAETIKSLGFASIGAAFMGVGTGLENPSRIMFIQNLTDASLMFSLDGVNEHFALPANGFLLLDVTANKTADEGLFFQEGQRLYVKEIGNPTSGSVYFSSFYGDVD